MSHSTQGSVEAMQAELDSLAAHVALRVRALNRDVASAAAASGVSAEDLGLETLANMEPERECWCQCDQCDGGVGAAVWRHRTALHAAAACAPSSP
jgi:hypothetical protein